LFIHVNLYVVSAVGETFVEPFNMDPPSEKLVAEHEPAFKLLQVSVEESPRVIKVSLASRETLRDGVGVGSGVGGGGGAVGSVTVTFAATIRETPPCFIVMRAPCKFENELLIEL